MTEAERLAQALAESLTEAWGVVEEGRRQWRVIPVEDADKAAAILRAQAAEIEALKQTLHDELDANLRLRELGGARSDEPMTTFLERVFAERDALRADAERLEWLEHWLFEKRWNGVIGAGSQTDWTMAGNWRHITVKMRGHTFRAAIDAARQS